jgi:serine/threonine kinase 19
MELVGLTCRALMECGVLTLLGEGKARSQGYQLGCPRGEKVLSQVREGRKEIIQILSRCRFQQQFVEKLEKQVLRKSTFPVSFHLKDLLGGGHIESQQVTPGMVVRLIRKQ